MIAKANKNSLVASLSISAERFDELHRVYIDHSLHLLMTLSTFWANMIEIKISSQPVPLYGVQTAQKESGTLSTGDGHSSLPNTPFDDYVQTFDPLYGYTKDFLRCQTISIFESDAWQAPSTIYKEIQYEESSWDLCRKPASVWPAEELQPLDISPRGRQLLLSYPMPVSTETEAHVNYVI